MTAPVDLAREAARLLRVDGAPVAPAAVARDLAAALQPLLGIAPPAAAADAPTLQSKAPRASWLRRLLGRG